MKILFFSDTHGDDKALEILRNRAKDVDGIVCAGDISIMERDLKKVMKKLNSFGKPLLMIHGNHEDEEGLKDLCEKHENITFLHFQKRISKANLHLFVLEILRIL